MYERALDSIRQSLSNPEFPLHAFNLTEEKINQINKNLLNLNMLDLIIYKLIYRDDMDYLEKSNESQKKAIKCALQNQITLIQV